MRNLSVLHKFIDVQGFNNTEHDLDFADCLDVYRCRSDPKSIVASSRSKKFKNEAV